MFAANLPENWFRIIVKCVNFRVPRKHAEWDFFFFYCIYTHLSDYPDKICYSRERRYVTDHKWISPFSGIPQVQNTMNSLDQ